MRADHEAELRRLETLADWLDSRFRLPGTNFRFGLDGLLGLVPGVGDTVTGAAGAYVIVTAYRLGAPTPLLARMGANTAIDWIVGSIPLVGDLLDFGFKANRRNTALLRRHLETSHDIKDVTPPA